MRTNGAKRLTLAMIAIAALVALAIKAGAADPSTMPTTVASAGTMPATTHVAATHYVAVIRPAFICSPSRPVTKSSAWPPMTPG